MQSAARAHRRAESRADSPSDPQPKATDMKAIWIELPALDLARATRFYSTMFGHPEPDIFDDGTRAITVIPGEPTVALNRTAGYVPRDPGILPYFTVDEPLSAVIERTRSAGGSVVEHPGERPGFGFFAIVCDTEGNHVYVHSGTA